MGSFNTQPPEGGWGGSPAFQINLKVSTHSRPKAAGNRNLQICPTYWFQHTAARRRLGFLPVC